MKSKEKDSSPPRPEARRSQAAKELTERGLQRAKEDERFIPVILKRTDEARRHPDDVLEHAVAEGLEQLKRPSLSLFLSAISAGLILSFTAMAVASVASSLSASTPLLTGKLAIAMVYPLGFVLCVMSGTQLFTEHTATAVYPVLDRRSSLRELLRLWSLVALGNLSGAGFGAILLFAAEPVIEAAQGYKEIALHLTSFDILPLLASSLLAGWLMALGAWLTLFTAPTLSQMMSIFLVTFVIGIGGLHHSIAGAVEIFAALLVTESLSLFDSMECIVLALLGNLVGGSLFVGVLNYAHIRETQTVS